jgi:hypothetical protein
MPVGRVQNIPFAVQVPRATAAACGCPRQAAWRRGARWGMSSAPGATDARSSSQSSIVMVRQSCGGGRGRGAGFVGVLGGTKRAAKRGRPEWKLQLACPSASCGGEGARANLRTCLRRAVGTGGAPALAATKCTSTGPAPPPTPRRPLPSKSSLSLLLPPAQAPRASAARPSRRRKLSVKMFSGGAARSRGGGQGLRQERQDEGRQSRGQGAARVQARSCVSRSLACSLRRPPTERLRKGAVVADERPKRHRRRAVARLDLRIKAREAGGARSQTGWGAGRWAVGGPPRPPAKPSPTPTSPRAPLRPPPAAR